MPLWWREKGWTIIGRLLPSWILSKCQKRSWQNLGKICGKGLGVYVIFDLSLQYWNGTNSDWSRRLLQQLVLSSPQDLAPRLSTWRDSMPSYRYQFPTSFCPTSTRRHVKSWPKGLLPDRQEAKEASFCQVSPILLGLVTAPRTFTKLLKLVATSLRQQGLRLILYLDNILLTAESPEKIREHMKTLISTLLNRWLKPAERSSSQFYWSSLFFSRASGQGQEGVAIYVEHGTNH